MKTRNLILALIVFGNLTAISAPLTARPNVKKYEAQELQRQEQLRRQRATYEAQELRRREQIRQQAIAAERAERKRQEGFARQRLADAIARIAEEEAAKAAKIAKLKSTITGPTLRPKACKPEEYLLCWGGRTTDLIGAEDYPLEASRKGITGTVEYELSVSTNGRVEKCTIVESSGSPLLDETTCRLMSIRARFNPAQDGTGAPVLGVYRNRARWSIRD